VTLALRGEHQVGNAVVAAALLEAAAEAGVSVSASHIEQGLAAASWPARLERFSLDSGHQVLLDAAHNADGADALAAYLRRWYPRGGPCLVVGIMRDKDVDLILRALLPAVARVIVTAAATPRALPASELAVRVSTLTRELGLSHPAPIVVPEPHAAIQTALSISNDVCVAGSIFLVGAVRDHLAARAILP
jgi:dihydrofolate synthase/folylpolyglutamate synthase